MPTSRTRPKAKDAQPPARRPALVFDREACHDLPAALAREWLETDGLGGYAALSSLFCPTRRQHGLLVAPYAGNPERHVFLQRFEETLHVAGRALPLSVGRYPGLYAPHGHASLARFTAIPWPESVHRFGDATVVREVLMARGTRAVLLRYRVEGTPGPVRLDLQPLLPCRPANGLTHENALLNPRSQVRRDGVAWRPYPELPRVIATVGGAPWRFEGAPVWYRRVEHLVDLARGYEGHEDVFCPGVLALTLVPGTPVVVAVGVGDPVADPVALFDATARERRLAWASAPEGLPGLLAYGADRFLARGADGTPTVLAGFPWFAAWGRDTCLAVPGLHFARGAVEAGGDVLAAWSARLRDGLLPNRLTERGEAEYTAADASLWFALATHRYDAAGGAAARLRAVFLPALRAIVAGIAHHNPVLGEDAEGLPWVADDAAGADRSTRNPTWMDARVDGVAVTPRLGCPVEIAGLWVFARRWLVALEGRFGTKAATDHARGLADRSAATFRARFGGGPGHLPPDVWRPPGSSPATDAALRPNALIAAALPLSPLSTEERRAIVRAAEAHLLTPRGLRTLAPGDAAYRPRYEGDVAARDRAYHQGTAWPWLLGAYVEATLAAFGRGAGVRRRLRALLDDLAPATAVFGLGHLAELYDGDPPHRPGGTFAQAWSDAEVLRAYALLDATPRRP